MNFLITNPKHHIDYEEKRKINRAIVILKNYPRRPTVICPLVGKDAGVALYILSKNGRIMINYNPYDCYVGPTPGYDGDDI